MSRSRITPSAVIALVALVLAMGGTAFAGRYIITKTGQIKPSVRRALKGQRGPQGAQGAAGPVGPVGPAGPAGPSGTQSITEVAGPEAFMGPSGSGTEVDGSLAQCPAGMVVLGGGWDGQGNPPVDATAGFNNPLGGNSWEVIMANNAAISGSFHAVAICAPGANAAVTRTAVARAATARSRFSTDLARMQSRFSHPAHAACVRAIIAGQSKCIARGQYCKHTARAMRDYRRYGFSCTKRDYRGRYHLQ